MDERFDFQSNLPGQWVRVRSSWIEAARWQGGRLEIRTSDGKVLPYATDEGTFRRFLEASSKGRFVTFVLKPNYQFLG